MHHPTWHMSVWLWNGEVLKKVSATRIEGFTVRAAKAHRNEGNSVCICCTVSVFLRVTRPIHPQRFPLTAFGWGLILGSLCWSSVLGCTVDDAHKPRWGTFGRARKSLLEYHELKTVSRSYNEFPSLLISLLFLFSQIKTNCFVDDWIDFALPPLSLPLPLYLSLLQVLINMIAHNLS